MAGRIDEGRTALARGRYGIVVAAALGTAAASPAAASAVYTVSFDDSGGQFSGYYAPLRQDVQAAGAAWSGYTGGSGSIDVLVRFADLPTMSGVSATSVYAGASDGLAIYEQGVLGKLRSGIDANGAAPDAVITIGRTYLTNELWLDPDPYARTAAVPASRTDAESALLHEFGHILAFSGWRDPTSGALPGGYESSYDRLVAGGTGGLYFTGADAEALYGGPVPLTSGSYQHLGNEAPLPGSDLLGDLMNGVSFYRGTRYWISPLDIAMLDDVAAPLAPVAAAAPASLAADAAAVPEPGTLALLAVSLGLLHLLAGRARRRGPASPPASRRGAARRGCAHARADRPGLSPAAARTNPRRAA